MEVALMINTRWKSILLVIAIYMIAAIAIVPAIGDPRGTPYWIKFPTALIFAIVYSVPIVWVVVCVYLGVLAIAELFRRR